MTRLEKVVAGVALVVVTAGCGAGARALSAADQVPGLAAGLERVDHALAAHRFDEARRQLRELKSEVVDARNAGKLDDADAQRSLTAIANLMRMLPAASPTSSTPSATASTTTGPRTTRHRSNPSPTDTAVPSPTGAPAPTPSPSSSPTQSPSPTDGGTGGGTPTPALATSTP